MFLDRSSAIFHGSNKETVLTQNPSQGFSVRLFLALAYAFHVILPHIVNVFQIWSTLAVNKKR